MRRLLLTLGIVAALGLGVLAQQSNVTNAVVIAALQAMGLFGDGYADGTCAAWDTTTNRFVSAACTAGGAPTDATYITQTPATGLSAEQPLNALASGIMRVATTTGVITALTTSAGIAANVNDESGTGVMAFTVSPILTTPDLGTPSAAVLTNATGLPASAVTAGTFGTGIYGFSAGSLTGAQTSLSAAMTWNDAADVFTGLLIDITNTASDASSRAFEIKTDGSAVFGIQASNGRVYFGSGTSNSIVSGGGGFTFSSSGYDQIGTQWLFRNAGTGNNLVEWATTLGTLKFTTVVSPASSGTRYLCIGTDGTVSSSAAACAGT